MKMKNLYRTLMAVAIFSFASCTEDIVIDNIDEGAYSNLEASLGMLRDGQSGKLCEVVDLYDQTVTKTAVFNLSRAPQQGVDVEVSVDSAYLREFNSLHNTQYRLYPIDKVKIQNNGKIVIVPGERQSFSLGVELSSFAENESEEGVSYALPLKATITSDQTYSASEKELVYVIQNHRNKSFARANRKIGEKSLVCYLEVNDTHPLNVLQWETEDGRLLADYVVLFAYNINYDREKGEIYVSSNNKCQFILDHYDQMVKPLQERGIKVLMGLLGNHDEAGLAQLSPSGCKMFAKKVADMCYTYGFDGINIDDEYSDAPDLSNPLFCSPCEEAGARLCLEIKKAMPDKLVTLYQLGNIYGLDYIDGIEQGYYMDMIFANYGEAGYPKKGLTLANCSANSVEFAKNQYYYMTLEHVREWAASEYGSVMIFGPWAANKQGNHEQFEALDRLAQGLLNSHLKTPEFYYPETMSFKTLPYKN